MLKTKTQDAINFLKTLSEEIRLRRSSPETARKLGAAANHMKTLEGHKKRLIRQVRKIDPNNPVLRELEDKDQ